MKTTTLLWRTSRLRQGTAASSALLGVLLLATSTSASVPLAAGGQHEGIKVHGNWTIEVRAADGTLIERHQFPNAFESTGQPPLAMVLAGNRSPGPWTIRLAGSSLPGSSACLIGSNPTSCDLVEPPYTTTPAGTTFEFVTLKRTVPASGTDAGKLVLAGTATAQRDGDIGRVHSIIGTCPATTPPATPCVKGVPGYESAFFSAAQVGPYPLKAGQIIQVTVVISFSASTTP